MTLKQDTLNWPESVTSSAGEAGRKLRFDRNNAFQTELRRRVDHYFQQTGQPQRDCAAMYCKTAVILLWFAATYGLLVFVAQTWWQVVPLSMFLGLAMAAIGFNIQHDASHQAYSDRPWLNQLMALTMDMVGGSSYVWYWKHHVFHHTYANIAGYDADVSLGGLGRLTPHQPWLKVYQWQHLYLWMLYGAMAINWHLYEDFNAVIRGRIGENAFPRPKGWDLVKLLGGKAVFFTLAFGIPLMHHSIVTVLLVYGLTTLVLGVVLSLVFQLAHCVDNAEFPLPLPGSNCMASAWAIHQVETTVNFSRHNPVLTWFLGGLNFQVEHHLLPRICHIHYPALAPLVQATCQEFGVTYREHSSFLAGVGSHVRWLQQLGRPPEQWSEEAAG
jgi:linoleoyl-CoA desaturase